MQNGSWNVSVQVHDKYDFNFHAYSNIDSFVGAIGGIAATAAWAEQIPIIGAIKTYHITVNYSTNIKR